LNATKKDIVKTLKKAYSDERMFHGTATLKVDLKDNDGSILRSIGEIGEITAYLPDDDTFAVMFERKAGPGNWFTFMNNLEMFNDMFDVVLNEDFEKEIK